MRNIERAKISVEGPFDGELAFDQNSVEEEPAWSLAGAGGSARRVDVAEYVWPSLIRLKVSDDALLLPWHSARHGLFRPVGGHDEQLAAFGNPDTTAAR